MPAPSDPRRLEPKRSPDRLRAHYEIEKQLAARLRTANPAERPHLYSAVYDELFRRVPDHPMLTWDAAGPARAAEVARRVHLLRRFLRPSATFLELGPGDCSLAIAIASHVKKVIAVESSREIANSRAARLPANVELVFASAGAAALPVAPATVDIAYNDQLIEHLYPDDVPPLLRSIYEALAPGGTCVCLTPNRLCGPHDISREFDDIATGLHLKEYTTTELAALMRAAGFVGIEPLVGARGTYFAFPLALVALLESLLPRLPRNLARNLARGVPLRHVLGIVLVARKPS